MTTDDRMGDAGFRLQSEYRPTGDQPQAIDALSDGLARGMKHQVLLGVTGSGKVRAREADPRDPFDGVARAQELAEIRAEAGCEVAPPGVHVLG